MTRNAEQYREEKPDIKPMQLKAKEYLQVADRIVWFVWHQRQIIADNSHLDLSYSINTEILYVDYEKQFCVQRATVIDAFGNHTTAIGSESAKDFGDYIEKSETKAIGRALALLGYGTRGAQEFYDNERVVDAPVDPKQPSQQSITTSETVYHLEQVRKYITKIRESIKTDQARTDVLKIVLPHRFERGVLIKPTFTIDEMKLIKSYLEKQP